MQELLREGKLDMGHARALLAVLRSSDEPVAAAELDAGWVDPIQRDRCLASLLADGLAVRVGDCWALPT